MIKLHDGGVYLLNGTEISTEAPVIKDEAKKNTIAYRILKAHNTVDNMENLEIKFDK